MTLEYVKQDIKLLKERVKDLTCDSDNNYAVSNELTDKLVEIWYFIAATVILTSIGFILVFSII